jgi:hypothetical protein
MARVPKMMDQAPTAVRYQVRSLPVAGSEGGCEGGGGGGDVAVEGVGGPVLGEGVDEVVAKLVEVGCVVDGGVDVVDVAAGVVVVGVVDET